MGKIKEDIATRRVQRARSRVGMKTAYKLGAGGFDPALPTPAVKGACDCSGFVAWVIGLSRKPKASRPFWVETTAIYRDAIFTQTAFVKLDAPEPGCIVVYGDQFRDGRKISEGHMGVVTDVITKRNFDVVDCSSGMFKRTGDAINERSGAFFRSKNAIFICLKQDLA